MTTDQRDYDAVIDAIPPNKWQDILHDCRMEPITIDHYANKLFPKWPDARMSFRRYVRAIIETDDNQ